MIKFSTSRWGFWQRTAVLACCAQAGLLPLAHADTRSLTVSGQWGEPTRIEPGSPLLQGNALSAWVGQGFSLTLAYRDSDPLSDQAGGYPVNPDSYSHSWVWQALGPAQLTVAGVSRFSGASALSYVQITDNWAYDGSAGVLPSGSYDVIELFGMTNGCPATGPSYWGQCVNTPGYPDRMSFNIALIGQADLLLDAHQLPSAQLPLYKVLAVNAEVRLLRDGDQLVGAVEYLANVPGGALQRLVLSPVPEPHSAGLLAAGLLLVAALRRRRMLQG